MSAGDAAGARSVKVLTVSDLHCRDVLYRGLQQAVTQHQPDLLAVVGDFLDISGRTLGMLPTAECARILNALPCREIIFVRGNHEHTNWREFSAAWDRRRELCLLNGTAWVHGPLVVVGFPCLLGCADDVFERVSFEAEQWLVPLSRQLGPAINTLWLMHEPPRGTPLSERSGAISGNREWNSAIERFQPRLVVFGHDHLTPLRAHQWNCRLFRNTTCVNVGQTLGGPLHYTVMEFEFPNGQPSQPGKITVSAYPRGQAIEA